MAHAPAQHLLGALQDQAPVRRIIGQVAKFRRVLFEVEEQRRQGGEMDVFVAGWTLNGYSADVHELLESALPVQRFLG